MTRDQRKQHEKRNLLDQLYKDFIDNKLPEAMEVSQLPLIEFRNLMSFNNEKLKLLAELEGYDDVMELLETATFDSVAMGICINPNCDYCTEVEPDCSRGWCEACETNTVKSCLILAGII